MAADSGSNLAAQVFALAKDLAKVEQTVEQLGERGDQVHEALAALDLNPVQEAIDHLEERTAGLQEDVGSLDSVQEGLTALTRSVAQIRKDLDTLAAGMEDEKLALWDWTAMDQEQAKEAWDVLITWVRNVLAREYGWVGPPNGVFAAGGYQIPGSPQTPPRIPPCWYRHREAVWELSWLCQEWHKLYKTSYGTPSKAGDWYDRYARGVKQRLVAALDKCRNGHVDDSWLTDPNHPEAPRGIDDDEALSHWLSWDFSQRKPAPAPGPVEART
ncbi:hypothetical protein KN815_16060 [Streptomyces sp. 4503]|uniref:Uncharacterized protein n=1 Tax=Streptomyces niphimycinicus TaxID=2842201 RepID=A0ABS6CF57_9ACTN|nr:hypothetical protein [Streptomyces niphimycinicus]MBU3865536.1 hypothetical protein [Streptomyces niphimycinicus]